MRKHLAAFLIFAGLLFSSCDSVFNNSAKDSETGTISFYIQSKREAVTKENQDSTYQIIVKLSGDYSDEKKVELTSGKSCSVDFGKINVGTKIVAEVEISQNEKLIYKGKSEEYTVKAGENKVTVVLEKLENDEEEKEEEVIKVEITGSIIFPEMDFGNLKIQIDETKTPEQFYRNLLEIVLKATDLEGNVISEDINWNVSLSYQGNEVNKNKSIYTFDSETSTLKLTTDLQSGYSNYLGIGGVYQVYAVATYKNSKSSAFFDIPVAEEMMFEISPETEIIYNEELERDCTYLKEAEITDLTDYITNQKINNLILKFKGSFDSETIAFLQDAINLVQVSLYTQSEMPLLKYTLDLSAVQGFTEVQQEGFCINIPDNQGNYERRKNGFLKKVILPESITSIGEEAFYECTALEYVNIPEGVTTISPYCFSICKSLKSLDLPDSVNEIHEGAFSNCEKLSSITIPDGVEYISDNCFENCYSLKDIDLPDTITSIGNSSFKNCKNLEVIVIPDLVTDIGIKAFEECRNLRTINLPLGVSVITERCFYDCYSLNIYPITAATESIEQQAFYNCKSLTQITIPANMTEIPQECFYGCSSLTSIMIPAKVKTIGSSAFNGCSKLTSVTFEENSELFEIGSAAFFYDSLLTEITIPASVEIIMNQAFWSSNGEMDVTLVSGNKLKAIAGGAFKYANVSGFEGTWKKAGSSDWSSYCKYLRGSNGKTLDQISGSGTYFSDGTWTFNNESNYYYRSDPTD